MGRLKWFLAAALFALAVSVAGAQEWVDISQDVYDAIPNYKDSWKWNRKIGAMKVDAVTCDLYVIMSNGYGVFKSSDQGMTYEKIDQNTVKGRGFGFYGVNVESKSGAMAVFMVGKSSGITFDHGKTWQAFGVPKDVEKHDGWSWGMVDWTADKPSTILAKEHHSERLWLSHDLGQSWEKLEIENRDMGVVDSKTFLLGKKEDGIYRSTDGGKTWTKVYEGEVLGNTPVRYGEHLYWMGAKGVLISSDGGATWKQWGSAVERPLYGPVFGESEAQMIVANDKGLHMTKDAGKTWKKAADFPVIEDGLFEGKYGERYALYSFGWDWKNNVLFASCVGGGLRKIELGELH